MCGRARKGHVQLKSNSYSGTKETEGLNLVVWARLGLLQGRCDCLVCTSTWSVSVLGVTYEKRVEQELGVSERLSSGSKAGRQPRNVILPLQ